VLAELDITERACRRTGASRRSSAAARSISVSIGLVAVPALALAATGFAVRNRA